MPTVKRDDLRNLWRDRLEGIWRQAFKDALEGRPGAITAAVRVHQAAALLDGLNAPSVLELSTPSQHEIDTFVAEIIKAQGGELEESDIFEGEIVEET